MTVSSLICEFDPLHKGHKYLLDTIRQNGSDMMIACMSGNFTQRGEPALFDKYTRTKAALLCGADIVIELPVFCACCGAERFAFGGVTLLHSLGIVDRLYFGSECGDIRLLRQAALAADDSRVTESMKVLLRDGLTFAAAREKAVEAVFGKDIAHILKTPNNILGTEYIKALESLNSSIVPCTVARTGTAHDSKTIHDGFVSASYLRELFISGEMTASYFPEPVSALFSDYRQAPQRRSRMDELEKAMLYRLRMMTLQELAQLPDISEGLENRLYKAIRTECSVEAILQAAKSKRYTMARLRRILLHAFLGFTRETCSAAPAYIRLLGFNTKGRELLRLLKQKAALPIISTPSKLPPLSEEGKRLFALECRCDDLYALSGNTVLPCGSNITTPLVTLC